MAFAPHGHIKTNYQLPNVVEKFCTGWVSTLQSAATVSALLASVEAQLLGFFKTNLGNSEPNIQKAVLLLTYIALILSIGVTMTSMFLTDEFSEVPTRSARAEAILPNCKEEVIVETNWKMLEIYHIKPKTKFVIWHHFTCLSIACLCTIASVALFAASQEPMVINIVASTTAFISLLPLIWFLLPASTLSQKVVMRESKDIPYSP
ncbi:hypothetical protein DL96DRAFT_1811851 [Flagelloscypha sp. PMI_526]|nr:hypothetical protein DL96DRAFT_1811851 [Flagelloscypha sp. PMI_526]